MSIHAIYENGVFRPMEPVNLPEHAEVALEANLIEPAKPAAAIEDDRDRQAREETLEILSHRYHTGYTDTAARHNEHQP